MDLANSIIRLYQLRDEHRNSIDKRQYNRLITLIDNSERLLSKEALSCVRTFYEYSKNNPITDDILFEFKNQIIKELST